jgi:phosphatidylglycerophosphate synthase
MSANSRTHRLVRPLARMLVRTPVTPDHLTWLRAITGGLACAGFAYGSESARIAGGVVWIISALLDRADGELARVSNRISAAGHRLDTYADTGVNAAMFIAVGIGLRDGAFGPWAIALGALCSLCMFLCARWCYEIESKLEPGAVVLGGAGGFDPDDLFYLIGPFAWTGLLNYVLAAGAVMLPPTTIAIGVWRWRATRRARLATQAIGARLDPQTRKV